MSIYSSTNILIRNIIVTISALSIKENDTFSNIDIESTTENPFYSGRQILICVCYNKCWISAKVAIGSHPLDILVLLVFSAVFLYDFTSRLFCAASYSG